MKFGMMVDGKWTTGNAELDQSGKFEQMLTTFRSYITADGSSGFEAEAGRYHLYVCLGCPWAQRTLIMRSLKGLEAAIGLSIVSPFLGKNGWEFSDAPGTIPDSINHAQYLRELYLKADPNYTGKVTVPVLWDKQTATIVNNESREIIRMFDIEFANLSRAEVDLYPVALRAEIDAAIDKIDAFINRGVYCCGFAPTQADYEIAVTELFENLDYWESVLNLQRYVCGNQITEADICMFVTLLRFDLVYHGHFKCNLRRIVDYPNLWNYLKDLYQHPDFQKTCNLDHIKQGYYISMTQINPTRIVPKGPIINFDEKHDRDRFASQS